jgi:hypothetical protein
MAKRKGPRLATVDQRVDYRHVQGQSTGTLINVSMRGCQIKGTFPFPCGTRLRLRLWLPGEILAVDVERAVVPWVKDQTFGVAFLELTPDARIRIDRALERLQERQPCAVQSRHEETIPSSAFIRWDVGQTPSMGEPEIRVGR